MIMSMHSKIALAILLSWASWDCRDSGDSRSDAEVSPDMGVPECGPGLVARGPACVPVFSRCKQNEVALFGGGCKRVGAPAKCLPGWKAVKEGWCEPVLPAAKCAKGSMALIGKSTCQAIRDCGSSKYGNIQLTSKTIHVDRQYSRPDADGSMGKPYQSIEEALTASTSGAHIAVAAGEYQEDLVINKPVTLEGRCPKMVTVMGYKKDHKATIQVAASGTVIRGLSVTGSHHGVVLFNATKVLVDRCAITGNADPGLIAENNSEVTLRRTLVAGNHTRGVAGKNSSITVDACEIRETKEKLYEKEMLADGVFMRDGSLTVQDSLVVDNGKHSGVYFYNSKGKVIRSVIRGTRDGPKDREITTSGVGIYEGSQVTVQDSLISGNRQLGIYVKESSAHIERSIVRGTRTRSGDGGFGIGIQAVGSASQPAGVLIVRDSTISENANIGVSMIGGAVSLERMVIRKTGEGGEKQNLAWGIHAAGQGTYGSSTFRKLVLKVTDSLLEDNLDMAMVITSGTDVTVEQTTVRSIRIPKWLVAPKPPSATGIRVEHVKHPNREPPRVTVRKSLVESTEGTGLVLFRSGTVTVESSTIRSCASPSGLLEVGVMAGTDCTDPQKKAVPVLTMKRCAVEDIAGAGFHLFGAKARLEQCMVKDIRKPVGEGIYAFQDKCPTETTMSGCLVENCARAGLNFYGGTGKVCRSLFRKTTYAIVVDKGASPVICDDNRFEDNQRNVALGANLELVQLPAIPDLPKSPR